MVKLRKLYEFMIKKLLDSTMTIDTSVVMIWQKALIVCSSQLDIKQWGTVNSQTYINLPISATILRYTVSIWDDKNSSHFISVTGTADGYIQIVNATGVSTGTCFYLAITK
jgi:hypothetical protein